MFAGDGTEPYSALRDAGLARVVGFEPVVEECEKLNRRFGPPHRYLQYAIGDGPPRSPCVQREHDVITLPAEHLALIGVRWLGGAHASGPRETDRDTPSR